MNQALIRFVAIIFGAAGLACLLGVCLNVVTANVAVEYFSVHHAQIVETKNPWILAVVWGVAASWWFGAISGLIVASINHLRAEPLRPLRVLKWIAVACVLLWLTMIAILVAILLFTSTIAVEERTSTFEQDRRLVAVAMAHQYEYVLGTIALLVISAMTWRAKPASEAR